MLFISSPLIKYCYFRLQYFVTDLFSPLNGINRFISLALLFLVITLVARISGYKIDYFVIV